MSDGGKGSAPRPYSVDRETFESNWDAIFGRKQKQNPLTHESDSEVDRVTRYNAETQEVKKIISR